MSLGEVGNVLFSDQQLHKWRLNWKGLQGLFCILPVVEILSVPLHWQENRDNEKVNNMD